MEQALLNRTRGDKVIWATVILLALVSMLVVYSSTGLLAYRYNKGNTEIYLFKQIVFITLGIMLIYFAHRVNYTIYSRVAKILFLFAIPLLIYTLWFYLIKFAPFYSLNCRFSFGSLINIFGRFAFNFISFCISSLFAVCRSSADVFTSPLLPS